MLPSDLSVQHHFASINGIRFHYVEAGKGRLVVLLHGFPEMWWAWRYQIRALADAGYRVIVPDLRGYNDTDKTGPFDIETLCTDVRELIQKAGEKSATIVGHDWGGAITWHLASRMPEVCERIAVLNCPHPVMMSKALARARYGDFTQLRKSWYIFLFQVPFLPERLIELRGSEFMRKMYANAAVDHANLNAEEIEPLVRAIVKPGVAQSALGYYRAFARRVVLGRSPSNGSARVRCPSLLIWGKKDFALDFDSLVPGTERYVENLQIETIDNCGHFCQEEQPARVNELLLEFLAR